MSKSYVRPDDGATMVEAEPHQYVSAKILELQGRHPSALEHDEPARRRRCKARDGVQGGRRARQACRGTEVKTATRPENA
jgi:hypothetical protein